MSNNTVYDYLPVIVIMFIILITIGLMIDKKNTDNLKTLKAGAIERGYALYCPNDGRFEWKDECN